MIKASIHRAATTFLPVLSRLGTNCDDVGILMAHGVFEESPGPAAPPASSVSLQALRRSILEVTSSYSFVSMDEVASMLSGTAPWRKRCLALTFDDSLKCHAEIIAPKLVQWGIPATFYLSTETIDNQAPYWWLRLEYAMSKARGQSIRLDLPDGCELRVDGSDPPKARRTLSAAIRASVTPCECAKAVESVEAQLAVKSGDLVKEYPFAEPMTWEDARKLISLGMTVGSHTVSHPNLTLIDADQLRSEFGVSRQRIEQSCATPCLHMCYPYGYYSKEVCEAARAAGYATAVTAEAGWNKYASSPYALRRFSMPARAYKLGYVLVRDRLKIAFGRGDDHN